MISLSGMKANVIDVIYFPTSYKKCKMSRQTKLWFSRLQFPREKLIEIKVEMAWRKSVLKLY